jgi:transposase
MRTFGTEISGNRRPRGELSPEARAAILYGLEIKQSPVQLAKQFGVDRKTIWRTKKRFDLYQTTNSRPRTGRPEKLTQSEKRYIYMLARRNPSLTYSALGVVGTKTISRSTIWRVFRLYNLKKWRSKKRIYLTKDSA